VLLLGSRLFKVTDVGINRKTVCDFLLEINSKGSSVKVGIRRRVIDTRVTLPLAVALALAITLILALALALRCVTPNSNQLRYRHYRL